MRKSAAVARVSYRSLLAVAVLGAVALLPVRLAGAQVTRQPTAAQRPPAAPPQFRQLVPGLLVRTRVAAAAPANRRAELWDLLVGPGKRSAPVTLPGGAVIEVRGGSGRIAIGGREQELRSGTTLAIPDGASFELINARDDVGLSIRATIIIGRRP